MTPTIRSFIAIELSDEARSALAEVQNRLKNIAPAQTVRWIAPESLHLTLHFLGDVPANSVEKISGLLTEAASVCPPLTLTLNGMGCFPNTRRPRIVWIGVTGQIERLIKLYQDLGNRLKVIGFTPEARPYSPHLTIGRVRDNLPPPQLAQLGQVLEREQARVGKLSLLPATEISLMQSELKPTGPVYTPLARVKLNQVV